VQIAEQFPEVVCVWASERDHGHERRVKLDTSGLSYPGNDQFLSVAFAKHNKLGEVQLRVCPDRFADVLACLGGVIRQGDRPDCGGVSISVQPEVPDGCRIDAVQDARRVADQDGLRTRPCHTPGATG